MIVRILWKRWSPVLSLLLLVSVPAWAQEVDYNQEQYDLYTRAVNQEDPAARADAILDFVRQNPKLSLVRYANVKYVELMQQYEKQGKFKEVLSAGERFLELQPDDLNVKYLTGVAAFQLNEHARAVQYCEPVYQQNPNPGLLYILAVSYQSLSNSSKFVTYGEQVLADLKPADYLPGHLQIASGLRGVFAGNSWSKAGLYARKITTALDAMSVPQGTTKKEWTRYANAERAISYALLGQKAVKEDNWSAAVSNYQRAIQYTNDKNLIAEAYYYIGRGRWQQNRLEPAMQAFAKGSVMRGAANAKPCRKLLERLYKSTHNGSLAGLDEYIVRVTIQ